MMKEALISIIVPLYNVEKFLPRCIESILNQTYENLEVILVDDESTDNSGCICDEYAKKDSRIIVIHKNQRAGVGSARTDGLIRSSGDYVSFIDSDDWIELDMCEVMCKTLESKNVDIVTTAYFRETSQGTTKMFTTPDALYEKDAMGEKNTRYHTVGFRLVTEFYHPTAISPYLWGKLFKREVIFDAHINIPKEIQYGEDICALASCIPFVDSYYHLNQCFYHYNFTDENTGQLTRSALDKTLGNGIIIGKHLNEVYEKQENYDYLKRELVDSYYMWMNKFVFVLSGLSKTPSHTIMLDVRELIEEQKIILYGFGHIGKIYYEQLKVSTKFYIVDVVDKNKVGTVEDYVHIKSIEEIKQTTYDYILIAVLEEELAMKIKKELMEVNGIKGDKIKWVKPKKKGEVLLRRNEDFE